MKKDAEADKRFTMNAHVGERLESLLMNHALISDDKNERRYPY
nr:hypothetical protein [uncultured Methanolobus sp.]